MCDPGSGHFFDQPTMIRIPREILGLVRAAHPGKLNHSTLEGSIVFENSEGDIVYIQIDHPNTISSGFLFFPESNKINYEYYEKSGDTLRLKLRVERNGNSKWYDYHFNDDGGIDETKEFTIAFNDWKLDGNILKMRDKFLVSHKITRESLQFSAKYTKYGRKKDKRFSTFVTEDMETGTLVQKGVRYESPDENGRFNISHEIVNNPLEETYLHTMYFPDDSYLCVKYPKDNPKDLVYEMAWKTKDNKLFNPKDSTEYPCYVKSTPKEIQSSVIFKGKIEKLPVTKRLGMSVSESGMIMHKDKNGNLHRGNEKPAWIIVTPITTVYLYFYRGVFTKALEFPNID